MKAMMENEIGVAFEAGMYRDFTGYISFNGVEAYVRNATFSLKEFDSVVIHFTCGEWLGGVWPDGIWHDGTWHGGTWRMGMWMNGTWLGGTFEGGNWYHGTWLDGTWTGGCWHGGQWNGCKWVSGERVGKCPVRNYMQEEFMESSGTTAPGMTGCRR